MFGIRYMKAAPTTYVIQYKNGRIIRQGSGLSFFYYAPTSIIVAVPLNSADVPYVFTEATADFQTITLQGQLSYRIKEPVKAAEVLDYSLDFLGNFRSEDPALLGQRLIQETQVLTRSITQNMPLREALKSSDVIATRVLDALKTAPTVAMLGVEILAVNMLQVRTTPEMSRALEAEAREELQKRADEAIYARRNAAVEQERRIKESELNTEIAVEEKKRTIRETQMAAEIAVEEQRTKLIDQQVNNDRKQADARGYALETTFKPLRDLDWKLLMAASNGGADPKVSIALAFRELAANAGKIGELNMTPDLLKTLVGRDK